MTTDEKISASGIAHFELGWVAACEQFHSSYPDTMRVTPREFAWQAYIADCHKAWAKVKTAEHLVIFDREAQGRAYLHLLQEHKLFNEYV
jgi:hypothetical protein